MDLDLDLDLDLRLQNRPEYKYDPGTRYHCVFIEA